MNIKVKDTDECTTNTDEINLGINHRIEAAGMQRPGLPDPPQPSRVSRAEARGRVSEALEDEAPLLAARPKGKAKAKGKARASKEEKAVAKAAAKAEVARLRAKHAPLRLVIGAAHGSQIIISETCICCF